jgi:hypothetical protein
MFGRALPPLEKKILEISLYSQPCPTKMQYSIIKKDWEFNYLIKMLLRT